MVAFFPCLAQSDPVSSVVISRSDPGSFSADSGNDADTLPDLLTPDNGFDTFNGASGPFIYYLRIGANVSRPLIAFAEPARFGIEGVADLNINHEYFAVAEAGFSRRNLSEENYQIKENGIFLRLGADKNFYKEFDDVVAVGARLGFAFYNRGAPYFKVEDGYWGDYSGSLASDSFFKQWAEVVLVLKTELVTNLYMGWNLRGKLLLFDKGDEFMDHRYIPGFGEGEVKTKLGFDFYLYYRFPVRRASNPGRKVF